MIEVSPVFVAVTRDAGVRSGTPLLRLAPQLVTLALQPPLNLRRSAMTDRRLKLSRSRSPGFDAAQQKPSAESFPRVAKKLCPPFAGLLVSVVSS